MLSNVVGGSSQGRLAGRAAGAQSPYRGAVLITGREASRLLREVLPSDDQARLLLRTGIAGEPAPSPHGPAFDSSEVEALRLRPPVDEGELAASCPQGVWLARLPREAKLDVQQPWPEVARQVSACCARQRPMTALSAALAAARIEVWGWLPFIATFLGYVVLTADVTGLTEAGPQLRPPGLWSRTVDGCRWHTPRGGRPQYVWTGPAG